MTINVTRLRPALTGILAATMLASCASERVKAENKAAKENSKDYVEYYPTGSNIPVRVRKDQLKTSDQRTAEDQRALEDAQSRDSRAMAPAGMGK